MPTTTIPVKKHSTSIYGFNHTVSFKTMPASKIDSHNALTAIAKELSTTTGISAEILLQDVKKMDEVLGLQEKFNWEMVGM
jgi:hypothetical protein